MKRFEDYKQEVILTYKNKKNTGKLSPNLQRHTPAKLKKECLDVFYERYTDKDSDIFTALFSKKKTPGEYFKSIQDSDPDIFKPLNTFLRKDTDSGTNDRNIELLAWLIDFKPRPHQPADVYDLVRSEFVSSTTFKESDKIEPELRNMVSKDEVPSLDESGKKDVIERKPWKDTLKPFYFSISSTDTKNIIPQKFNKTVLAFLTVFIVMGGSYLFYSKNKKQCMYWDGIQYKSIAYDQKVDGAVIIALDTFRLAHLKKIENVVVITRNDIGKVHYSKVNGKVDFFTIGGENPADHRKRLLPMTEYIYEKYVLDK